jgi:3-oxoacyl-[acyl-carrier protein] reductase
MPGEFEGQVAVVTGAAQGLGAATARRLAEAGAKVFLVDLNAERVHATAAELLKAGLDARAMEVDVADPVKLATLRKAIVRDAGSRLDVLVNNAGGWRYARALEIQKEDWDWTFRVNVETMFFCTQALVDLMIARRYGRIVNVASTDAYRPKPTLPHYAAAKAAVVSLTKTLAEEFAPHEILVNCVSPGAMLTETAKGQSWLAERIKQIPLQRAAEPSEIADLILFLASPKNRFMVGEAVLANGGILMA